MPDQAIHRRQGVAIEIFRPQPHPKFLFDNQD